jgi:hypothetical protein
LLLLLLLVLQAPQQALQVAPSVTLIGRMPLPRQQLDDIMGGFDDYWKQLTRKIVDVTSLAPPAVPAEGPAGPAAAAAAMDAALAGAAKAAPVPPTAAGKSDKERPRRKAANEEPSTTWLPLEPVFDAALNRQWHELLQQV